MPEISKEEIIDAIENVYNDDLEFIERLNNMTWARKVTLRQQMRGFYDHRKAIKQPLNHKQNARNERLG